MTVAWLQRPAYLLSVTMLLMTLAASSSAQVNANGVLVCSQAGFYNVSLADDGTTQAGSYCPLCVSGAFVFLSLQHPTFGKRLATSYLAWQRLAALPAVRPTFSMWPFTRAPPWVTS